MILPPETLNCFDLPPIRAGLVRIRHLCLLDVAVLARGGVDILAPGSCRELAAVFAVLAGAPGRAHPFRLPLAARLGSTARQRAAAAAAALKIALSAAVPGAKEEGREDLLPTGYGWPLEAAERLMAEYGMSFEAAATMPLARAYALCACGRVRCGGRAGGPDYWERATVANIIGGGQ